MKKRSLIAIVMLLMLCQASLCFAQAAKSNKNPAANSLKAGTTEVSVTFSGAYNTAGVTPFIGYFISDEIEIGGSFLAESGNYESNSYTTTALTLLGRYNIPIEDNLVVFAEVGLEQVTVDRSSGGEDRTAFLIGGGWKVFPSKAFSMNLSLDYVIGSYDRGNSNIDTDSLRLAVGLSVFIF